jgi:hypothetical protein
MRQDPDIIFVGEVRDADTALMAVRAALTGHQVFTTLHTNDAIGCIPRLGDIGVPGHLLAGSLIGALAQRLARKLHLQQRKVRERSANCPQGLRSRRDPIRLRPVGVGHLRTSSDTDDQTACAFRAHHVGSLGRENRCSASLRWRIPASGARFRTYRVGWQPVAGSFILTRYGPEQSLHALRTADRGEEEADIVGRHDGIRLRSHGSVRCPINF